MTPNPAKRLLIVDDNESDIELITLALEELGCTAAVSTAHNGEEALTLLAQVGAGTGATPPDAMLLDLNMPRMGGLEVLATIAGQPALAAMPVAVLTTSDSPRDRAECLRLGARLYIVKAYRLADFIASLKPLAALLAPGAGDPPATPPHVGAAPQADAAVAPASGDAPRTERSRSERVWVVDVVRAFFGTARGIA